MAKKENKYTFLYIQHTAQKFLDRELVGGLVLVIASIVALIIANSKWADAYFHFLENEFFFEFTDYFSFGLVIEDWINDGLMVIFFVVVGLELNREFKIGNLSSPRNAAMPLIAAVGGMLVPAGIYAIFNIGTPTQHGWGVPMATDIAYSLGIIALLGKRVPAQLKVFLVALAIADDMGAIMVIALFYTATIHWTYLIVGLLLLALLIIFNISGIKNLFWYILVGIILWFCFLYSGIHPTIAGVLFAFTIPIKPKLDSKLLRERAVKYIDELAATDIETMTPLEDRRQNVILNKIMKDTEHSRPPLLKLENSLLSFNAFVVLPIFALANAGVPLDQNIMDVISTPVAKGVILGLTVGKVAGITFFAWLSKALGIADLHDTLRWMHIVGMGFIAGIGFTVSLFITNLAFEDPIAIQDCKIGVLTGSLISIIIGLIFLYFVKPKKDLAPEGVQT